MRQEESYSDIEPSKLIATNPPYGMRSHNIKKIEGFYEALLRTPSDLYGGVRLVSITASTKQFESACQKVGVRVAHSRWVAHGGLMVKIYIVAL